MFDKKIKKYRKTKLESYLTGVLFCAIFFSSFLAWQKAFAADYYINQTATGSNDATSCANAKAISYLTGSWSGKVSAGDTVHLCGTLTSALTIGASGSSGSPITIKFETGAKFSAPLWSITGAIYGSSVSYILVDGGTNGIIENTANGTLLANQSTSNGIYFSGSSYIEVKNLTIQNLFVHSYMQGSGSPPMGSDGIEFDDSSNISAHDCIINNTITGILEWDRSGGTNSNIEFYNLTISRCNWGLSIVAIGGSIVSSVKIHNNDITIGENWAQSDGAYHLNGMYIFGNETDTTFTNFWFYNNYIHGPANPDGTWTCSGFIHFDYGNATGTRFFNNLLVGVSSDPMNGYIDMQKLYDTAGGIYNNTIIGSGVGNGAGVMMAQNTSMASWTIKNNIFINLQYGEVYGADATFIPDYNNFYGDQNAANFYTLSQWQTYLGGCPGTNRECNSIVTNPDLNTDYTPKVTSPVVGAGVNLTSLGITALNSDKNDVARPSTGAWDMGAYDYAADQGGNTDTTPPAAPSGLTIN
jgi:hypothetical protein